MRNHPTESTASITAADSATTKSENMSTHIITFDGPQQPGLLAVSANSTTSALTSAQLWICRAGYGSNAAAEAEVVELESKDLAVTVLVSGDFEAPAAALPEGE